MIRAYKTAGFRIWSFDCHAVPYVPPAPVKLDVPSNLHNTASCMQIDMGWSYPQSGQKGFELDISTDLLSWSALIVAPAALSATFAKLTLYPKYYFRIRALGDGVKTKTSDWSDIVTVIK